MMGSIQPCHILAIEVAYLLPDQFILPMGTPFDFSSCSGHPLCITIHSGCYLPIRPVF
jgi:hypothetical protein